MKDEELIANIRDAYAPPPVDADRFDAALHARIARPARRPLWVWGGFAAAAAMAAMLVFWLGGPQVSAPTPDVAPAPQIAAVAPSTPQSAGAATTVPAETTWLAELDYEAVTTVDDFGGLPDEYTELADLLEL